MSTLNILSIDIDAALRKLTEKRFKDVDEPALVLIRFAAGQHPKGIRIAFRNRSFRLEALTNEMPQSPFHQLTTLFDPTAPKRERSQMLSDLENSVGLDILAAFSGAPNRVEFTWKGARKTEGIRFNPGAPPVRFSPEESANLTIRIRGGLPARADPKKVAEKCRFSETPVIVNSALVNQGVKVEGALIRQQLATKRLKGGVGIPKEGDLTKVTFLEHGIISEELYMPAQGGLVFHAVIIGKRSDFKEVYPQLRQAAKRLLPPLAKGYPKLDEKRQRLAEVRLFDRYEVTKESILIKGVDAFRTIDGRRLDLTAVLSSAKTGNLYAIDTDSRRRSYAVKNRLVVIVNRRQRRFLDAQLPVPLRTPPKRIAIAARPHGMLKSLSQFAAGLKSVGNVVAASDLTEAEQYFVSKLQAAMQRNTDSSIVLAMTSGHFFPPRRVHRAGTPYLLISRHHPVVKKVIADVFQDAGFVEPALVLLSQ
jgi:hypothetical protein